MRTPAIVGAVENRLPDRVKIKILAHANDSIHNNRLKLLPNENTAPLGYASDRRINARPIL
jgi:hypothetical protein